MRSNLVICPNSNRHCTRDRVLFYDKMESHVRSLEVLQQDINHDIFTVIITSKTPKEFEKQIDLICQNVSCKLTLMTLLSKYVNQNSLKQFDFGCVVLGNTTNSNMTRLVKLPKRAARMVLKADFMIPSEQLFKDLNWLPFPKRVQYHTCLMVYKSITEKAPEYISSVLTYVSEHNYRQTRSLALDLMHIPRSY